MIPERPDDAEADGFLTATERRSRTARIDNYVRGRTLAHPPHKEAKLYDPRPFLRLAATLKRIEDNRRNLKLESDRLRELVTSDTQLQAAYPEFLAAGGVTCLDLWRWLPEWMGNGQPAADRSLRDRTHLRLVIGN